MGMQKVLSIDTSSNKQIIIGLRVNEKQHWIKKKIGNRKAQVVLPMIDRWLRQHKVSLKDLRSIRVNAGPGSFTGIRVGMAIANALSFALKIPIKMIK